MQKSSNKTQKYNRVRIRLKLIDILFTCLYLLGFQLLVSPELKKFSFVFFDNPYLAFTVYLAVFGLVYYVLDFPLHLYSSFFTERNFGLSSQKFFNWIKDDLKGTILSASITFIFLQVLYAFIRNFSTVWWVWMAIFWFGITILLAKVMPNVIIPLFFKYSPVKKDLEDRITKLSRKCGMKLVGVYEIDFSKKTNKLNAAVVGMGSTRRVILADNLIKEFTEDEVAGVLAHEFGHHKLRHMGKHIVFGVLTIFLSCYTLYLASSVLAGLFGATGASDIKIFPSFLLILFLAGIVMLPIQNAFSRKLETEADIFALKVMKDKNIFISLMNKLAEKNLADPNPSKIIKFFFYSHPPISERIVLAERF